MSVAAGNPTQAATTNPTAGSATASSQEDDDYGQDQVKVFSHEGDGENTEHLNSMDLHDIKTELERDAEKAETPKTVTNSASSPTFNADGSSVNATSLPVLPQASIRPVLHPPTAMVYANGGAVPFMIPPFAAAAAAAAASGSSLYPIMRPVKLESDWKLQGNGTHLNIPTYSYPAGFLPVDQSGLRPAYPFMTIPGQYVTTPMSYQTQFTTLGGTVAPNAIVQPNSGGMLTQHVKEKKPHIKKPLNAFMLFMKQKRADVIKECTLKESAAINQILGKMWHALDRSEQAKYYEMAREERAKHMQMYPGWSARDNYAVHKKRRKRKLKQPDSKSEVSEDRMAPDKELCSAAVSIPANLATPTATATSAPAQSQQHLVSTATTSPGSARRPEEEEIDLNNRKCRARFGLDQQHMWCGPCRRKKKCIRYSVGEDDGAVCKEGSEGGEAEEDEDVILGGGDVLATTSTAASVLLSEASDHHHHSTLSDKLPRLLSHEVPVTLQTIPT